MLGPRFARQIEVKIKLTQLLHIVLFNTINSLVQYEMSLKGDRFF